MRVLADIIEWSLWDTFVKIYSLLTSMHVGVTYYYYQGFIHGNEFDEDVLHMSFVRFDLKIKIQNQHNCNKQ